MIKQITVCVVIEAVNDGSAIGGYKLPCRTMSVAEQILRIICICRLRHNVIAQNISNFVRPVVFDKHLRVTGRVERIYEVIDIIEKYAVAIAYSLFADAHAIGVVTVKERKHRPRRRIEAVLEIVGVVES